MATLHPMETEYTILPQRFDDGGAEDKFDVRLDYSGRGMGEERPKPEPIKKPELTEEEKVEQAKIQILKDANRITELDLLTKLAEKITPTQVSDIKITMKIYKEDWKEAMNGPGLIKYLDELSKSEPKPNRFSPKDYDTPPEYNAGVLAGYLFNIGLYQLSNEARWIEAITSIDEPKEEATVEHFFDNLVDKLKNNKELYSELRYKAENYPRKVGQILEELSQEGYFQRNLIEFCATLDYKGKFKIREELQKEYLKSFDRKYKDVEFKTEFSRLASKLASTEGESVEDDYSDYSDYSD
ncbi:hypothetical protein LOD99_5897 [Oopsacas minuta]|uniref:Uncharacterized protein n=1 Tax=Oopsacas minuta TaxID=111878 RepID=A0AAV7JNG3_9METZ|nr:hypothetical protein LOD99_5897 [Oopsacas minuta]